MKEIELENKDLEKIEKYVKRYQSIHSDINTVLLKVDSLIKEKTKLEQDLVDIRKSETEWSEYIKEKYGEGTFDPSTGKYKLK